MTTPTAVCLLAAGKGTRMRSDLPKVLHEVAGLPMMGHALNSAKGCAPSRTVIVTGHQSEKVAEAAKTLTSGAKCVVQEPQLGTGHAVLQAKDALADFEGDVFILFADTPLIRPETLVEMAAARTAGAAVVVLGFEAETPGSYGRLIESADGLEKIVEAKDATEDELAVPLCNSGVMCVDAQTLFRLLDQVTNENTKGEYYLTDIVGLARADGLPCAVVRCAEEETLGVNSRVDLAAAEAAFQERARVAAMEAGVTLTDPGSVMFSHDTELGQDVIVEPNVVFASGVTVESGAVIRAFSHLEKCSVASGAIIGPYARLRPGAEIGEGARVGNFVEIKNTSFAAGAKANHLAYVGDAAVGPKANIGAGTITCNYDGFLKHRTEIGEEAFIGSNSALVAPVSIGARAVVAAGSVIVESVADDALAVARGRQTNKNGLATRLREVLADAKEKSKRTYTITRHGS